MVYRTLKKPWQFREVYRRGKKIDGKCAVLFYYRTGDDSEGMRIGVVASRKVGGAVARNRAKRRIREALRCQAGWICHDDLWIVVVARSAILNETYQALTNELERQLRRGGLIDK